MPGTYGIGDGGRDRQADEPSGEVPQPGEVPQDEELANDDDQAGNHIPAPSGVGDPDDQNTGHRGQPIADPNIGADGNVWGDPGRVWSPAWACTEAPRGEANSIVYSSCAPRYGFGQYEACTWSKERRQIPTIR